MAGIWARTDDTRGVHKAPANEVVRGVVSVGTAITKGEQEQLNPIGVNCIRAFPAQGIRVWGARTLSADTQWRYLNVRRLFNFIEESILVGTNWVVFEPNDQYLWESVRRTVSAFLRMVWRSGALMGATADEAFYVKCDEENNPPESRDAGNLVVEIGLAPVKPAEFVIFRISQFSQGSALQE
jgi:phage tail sheath protein FI